MRAAGEKAQRRFVIRLERVSRAIPARHGDWMSRSVDNGSNPAWNAAQDWFLHMREAPADARLRAGLAAWLLEDPAHAAAYRKVEHVWRLGGAVTPVARLVSRPDAPRRRWRGGSAGLAAAAVLAALLVLLPALQLRLAADYRTGTGEVREVTLADGSVVALAADSAIAVHFNDRERAIRLLAGEAYFEVAPDPRRNFRVDADGLTIADIGTAFDVRLGGNQVSVAVASGLVVVRGFGRKEEQLPAGTSLVTGDHTHLHQAVAPERVAGWRTGRFAADGATVAEVVDELRRYHHGMIILAGDALARRKVTGIYSLDEPVQALETLVSPFNGQVHQLTPYVLIISSNEQ
jgi:transmembrane sensor